MRGRPSPAVAATPRGRRPRATTLGGICAFRKGRDLRPRLCFSAGNLKALPAARRPVLPLPHTNLCGCASPSPRGPSLPREQVRSGIPQRCGSYVPTQPAVEPQGARGGTGLAGGASVRSPTPRAMRWVGIGVDLALGVLGASISKGGSHLQ